MINLGVLFCPNGCRNETKTLTCTDTTEKIQVCKYNEGDIEKYALGCDPDESTYVHTLTCNKPLFLLECTGTRILDCKDSNKVESTVNVLQNPVVTDNNGYYEFDGISAFDESGNPLKYYVKYVYNGMLYTNVYCPGTNEDNVSKAKETTQRFDYRTGFNNKFAEIGSYPSNYKIVTKVFGNELGDYNKVYLQEDITEIFKKISEKMVINNNILADACNEVYNDLQSRYKDKTELKRMIQFAADCRISAVTVKEYPLVNKFVIGDTGKKIGNVWYSPIYSGAYNQLHVNLGIKARPTFDLALYKDVLKAEVQINGKTEIYNYDSRKQSSTFKVGISEENYLNGLRSMYQGSNSFTNTQRINSIDADSYVLGMRNEEVANGQSSKYNASTLNNNYKTSNDYSLTGDDRLKVFVTYKIAIRNQSSVAGAVTEVVDYYDTNYNFIEAYIGDANGNKIGDVTKSDTSIYGNEFKSTKNAYKTMYLRPNVEIDSAGEKYIYVVLELVGPANDVGTLLSSKLLNNDTLNVMNLAEINGYKTYEGLIDIDSNPGNLNISNINALTQDNLVKYPNITSMYEDDTSRAPTIVYKISESKTIEGTVFEDINKNGILDNNENGINGVIVELIEIKNGKMIVRGTTTTNANGWYGFTGFVPGDYTIRYIYGADDATAMTTNSVYFKGLNNTSYNGQDYQSTYKTKDGVDIDRDNYKPLTDDELITRYTINKNNKNSEESVVPVMNTTKIDKYNDGYYWYTIDDKYSDARDDEYRVSQVVDYSRKEYGTEITNHKAEVFSSFENPQPDHIKAADNRQLASELERRTYRYAYTPVLEVEIEYATKNVTGNVNHDHNIRGVDFGVTLRPESELTIDQDIKHIKVTLSDGQVIFDTENGINDVPNLQWINPGKINVYDKNELLNAIIDEELMNGAKLEIIYNITVKNNSKNGTGTTRAKNIINYVSNNLNFDVDDNNGLWEVVSKDAIQNGSCFTLINKKSVDLSTQSVILKASNSNPLVSTNLNSGEQVTTELKLKKILSTESTSDDLRYTNMTEIVEIENTIGRYDHGAIPGNQKLNLNPCEHDTSGASRYTDLVHDPDGILVVTPPTGSNYNYYVYIAIGITAVAILGVGVFLIKKHVIK